MACAPVVPSRSTERDSKPRSGDRFMARGETAGYGSDCLESPGRGERCVSNTGLVSPLPGLRASGSNDTPWLPPWATNRTPLAGLARESSRTTKIWLASSATGKLASFLSAAILIFCATGCNPEKEQGNARDTESQRSVLLVLVDTLRADKLGCYGSDLGATPNIDDFAARSVLFESAFAHAPWTLPSMASIFTSLFPPQHGAGGRFPDFTVLSPDAPTVAEQFQRAGYATGAIVNVDFLTDTFKMTRGFKDVDAKFYGNNIEMRNATKTTDAALAWLKKHGHDRFFLLVHYFDPHLVYNPPAEYRRRFAAPEDREDAAWVFGKRKDMIDYRSGSISFDDETIHRAEKLYNGEVAYTDHEIGRLLRGLGELGIETSTVTAMTADHGEEFLDHGGFEHGHTLFNELVHVPLIMYAGAGTVPRRIKEVVGHIDLAPTLCALAGIEPSPTFLGRSLVPHLAGKPEGDHPVYMEGNFWGEPTVGLVEGGRKLVAQRGQTAQMFHLAVDPKEQMDERSSDAERANYMLQRLKTLRDRMLSEGVPTPTPPQMSEEQLRRLRSLGYIDSKSKP